MFATPEQRRDMTHAQVLELENILNDEEIDLDPTRRENLETLFETIEQELWPGKFETVLKMEM